jgi:molecular chaperone DnaK (HSP70)
MSPISGGIDLGTSNSTVDILKNGHPARKFGVA